MEVQHECLFGCTGKRDSWEHYLFCLTLWAVTKGVAKIDINERSLPRQFAGLWLTVKGCWAIAMAFTIYHDVREARSSGGECDIEQILEIAHSVSRCIV